MKNIIYNLMKEVSKMELDSDINCGNYHMEYVVCDDCPLGNCKHCDKVTYEIKEIAKEYIAENEPAFTWEQFKKGEIAVHCDTEEKAKDFLNKCNKESMYWVDFETIKDNETYYNEYKENTCYECYKIGVAFTSLRQSELKSLKIVKWNIKEEVNYMEKTFREVIADIKEGEVWESTYTKIYIGDYGIEIKSKSAFTEDTISLLPEEGGNYKLQRKEYTFTEAFAAYEEGKEIESCNSGVKYRLQHGGSDCYSNGTKTNVLCFGEIRGKWYINN